MSEDITTIRKMFNVRLDPELLKQSKDKANSRGKKLYAWVEDALRLKLQYEDELESQTPDQASDLRRLVEERAK